MAVRRTDIMFPYSCKEHQTCGCTREWPLMKEMCVKIVSHHIQMGSVSIRNVWRDANTDIRPPVR